MNIKRARLLSLFVVIGFVGMLAATSEPVEEEAVGEQPAEAKAPAAAPPPDAPDPNTFAIPDHSKWAKQSLPRAGVAIRVPDDVKITESGRITGKTPQAGPYVGLELPSGRDVQIDAMEMDIGYSKKDAKKNQKKGKLKIIHAKKQELVTQPRDVQGCSVFVCKKVGKKPLCVSTGGRSVHPNPEVFYPTLRDCGVLIGIMRSLAAQ